MLVTLAGIGGEFHREIVDSGRLAAFLYFIALLGTFGFIRTSTHMIRAQVSWWPGNVDVGGTHVHHLVWGILAMMIFGYLGVVHQPDDPWREVVAVFFGIGTGLTLDEFALWLELKDVYWEKDGRKSVDAMIVAGCLAALGMIGISAWATLADEVRSGVVSLVGVVGVFGFAFAFINATKEKFWMALIALVVWPAGVITAVRLAKPHSVWARLFYRERRLLPHGARKLERSRARYPGAAASAAEPPGGGDASGASGASGADATASS
ncbi:MAG: hypothetical protein GEU88_04985 [Solirubrobacterales bacterium]|nr:hypothetical protein [Solirubrobacterales bacterium]